MYNNKRKYIIDKCDDCTNSVEPDQVIKKCKIHVVICYMCPSKSAFYSCEKCGNSYCFLHSCYLDEFKYCRTCSPYPLTNCSGCHINSESCLEDYQDPNLYLLRGKKNICLATEYYKCLVEGCKNRDFVYEHICNTHLIKAYEFCKYCGTIDIGSVCRECSNLLKYYHEFAGLPKILKFSNPVIINFMKREMLTTLVVFRKIKLSQGLNIPRPLLFIIFTFAFNQDSYRIPKKNN